MSEYTVETKGELRFLAWDQFSAAGKVVHAFTTRLGGVSGEPYDTLNLAFHVGDKPENVLQNRRLACAALGIPPSDLVAGRQVHGDKINVVDLSHRGRGALSEHDALPDVDALITCEVGVPLSSFYADCVPIFLLDPVRGAVGLAHAGWKGTVMRIGEKTVQAMAASFGSKPGDCLAGIAPSIGPCCYEVDQPVVSALMEKYSYWEELVEPKDSGRWRLNLWEANRRTLLDAGLNPKNVIVSGLCTSCRNDLFFSYRAQGGRAGRMASFIMLI